MFKSYCSEPVEWAMTGDTDELCSHRNLRCWVWCWWNRWRFDNVLWNFIVCDDFFANKQQIMEIVSGSRFTCEVWGAVWTCNLLATQRFLTKVWRTSRATVAAAVTVPGPTWWAQKKNETGADEIGSGNYCVRSLYHGFAYVAGAHELLYLGFRLGGRRLLRQRG
jgi:hypothetical protein